METYKNFTDTKAGIKIKFQNIEFLRFLFAIIIVYFHILHYNIIKFATDTPAVGFYNLLTQKSSDAGHIVECFFIISGFFLFRTWINNKNLNETDFIKKKITRLWPPLAFFILIQTLLSFFYPTNTHFLTNFINLFFLQCVGLTLDFKGINWFVSPLFWTLIFYFYILKNFKTKYAILIIALCTYFSYVGNITYFNGNFGRETINLFFNSGLMRALGGVGLGFFIGIFYFKNQDSINKNFQNNLSCIMFSILEFLTLSFLIQNFIFNEINFQNKIIFVIIFSIMFFLFLIKKGVISKLLNNKYFAYFGKYSYSIYIMQQLAFWFFAVTFWKNKNFVENVPLCISSTVIFAILLGILTYYLIEKPAGKYLKKKFNI